MATNEEKLQSAIKKLDQEKRSESNALDRTYAERKERVVELEGLARYIKSRQSVFAWDPRLAEMLTNIDREAEHLLQKELDKLRIPA